MPGIRPIVLGLAIASFGTPALAGALDLRLDRLRPYGLVRVAVFADAASWRRGAPAFAERRFLARETAHEVVIGNLPPGRYAVQVEQEAQTGPAVLGASFGEAWRGASGRTGRYGRPSFEQAAVEVVDDPVVNIHLFRATRR